MKYRLPFLALLPLGMAAAAPPAVLMYHNDPSRTGANLQETALNTSNVNVSTFGKVFSRPVDDQLYAQLLYMPGIDIPGRGVHNVVFAATVNDTVYAFDADYADLTTPLWKKSFLSPGVVAVNHADLSAAGSCGGNYNDFSGNMGIVGTPVIDSTPFPGSSEGDQGTIYVVARTKENGKFLQRLHALDVRTGNERPGSPVVITASVPGTGAGSSNGTVAFNSLTQNQRPGLALVNGLIYIGWASHCDLGPYHGWMMAYDATTLQQVAVYNDTPNGSNGGIWMGGSPPSYDAAGNLYLTTGNGTVGANGNPADTSHRGESFVKLTRSGSTMAVSSFFTPYNYDQLEAGDIDLGSAGLLLMPGANGVNMAVGAGKQGRLYVVDRDNMGGVQAGSDSQIIQSIDVNLNNKIMGGPVYWEGPGGVKKFYIWCANTTLKAYTFVGPAFNPTPQTSTMNASNPGAMMSISANGNTTGTGIVWAMCPTADANQQVVTGVFRALNAENPSQELWNSTQNSARDAIGSYAKFNQATVTNGKVYLPTFSNKVLVYGQITTPENPTAPTDLAATALSKTQVHLQWTDNSSNEAGYAIERSTDGVNFDQITSLPADSTTFEDTSVVRFTAYTYRVRAYTLTGSAVTNTATATTNVGDPESVIQITGNGIAVTPGATATSAAIGTAFPQILVGQSSSSNTFTITNNGTSDLTLTGSPLVTLSGNTSDFTIVTQPSGTVTPGASTTLQIAFNPTENGTRTATVTIGSNDPLVPSFSFAISGAGALQNLAGWWRFNEGTGTTTADSSGNGLTATRNGGQQRPRPTWTPDGKFDSALIFSATQNQGVTVPDDEVLDPTSGVTLAAWIFPTAWNSGSNPRVMQKGDGDNQYRLLVEGGQFKFDVSGVGSITYDTLPALNVWSHVAGTYDGAQMKLLINGVVVKSAATSGTMSTTGDSLYIGTKTPTSTAGDHFVGTIDDVRVYGRGLGDSEIAALAAQAGTVSVVATTATAQKGTTTTGLFTFTRDMPTTSGLNVLFDLVSGSGKGIYRTDFGMSAIPPNIAISLNQASTGMVVTPLEFNGVTGTVDVTVKVVDGPGYQAGQNDTATVHILDSAVNTWKISKFGSVANANLPDAADDADPNGNGIVNLIEYALGTDPKATAVNTRAPVMATENIGGDDYLTLTYIRPKPAPSGVSYYTEYRPDFDQPDWGTATVVSGYPKDNLNGTETVKVRTPSPMISGPTGFLRLRVSRP